MNRVDFFANDERITMLEKAIESVMYQIRCDKYMLVNVRTLASLVSSIRVSHCKTVLFCVESIETHLFQHDT